MRFVRKLGQLANEKSVNKCYNPENEMNRCFRVARKAFTRSWEIIILHSFVEFRRTPEA